MKKLIKKATAIIAVISTLMMSSMIDFYAASVDFSGGVNQVTNKVTAQAKSIAGTVFGCIAIFCLAFTVAKGIRAAISYHRQENFSIAPVVAGGIGTIVAGMASLSTFFGWFGL